MLDPAEAAPPPKPSKAAWNDKSVLFLSSRTTGLTGMAGLVGLTRERDDEVTGVCQGEERDLSL